MMGFVILRGVRARAHLITSSSLVNDEPFEPFVIFEIIIIVTIVILGAVAIAHTLAHTLAYTPGWLMG